MFAVKRGEIKTTRIDVSYNHPKYDGIMDDLSAKCSVKPLGKYLENISGGATPLRTDESQYADSGVNFLRIQNVTAHGIDLFDVKHITDAIHNGLLQRSQLAVDDVLMTITGRIGTSAVVHKDCLPANINQHIVRMRIKRELTPEYLVAYLNSDLGMLLSNRGVTGTTRTALDYESIKCIPIPIVKSDKQKALVEIMQRGERRRAAKLREADALLAGMDGVVLNRLGVELQPIKPTLVYAVKLGDIRTSELFCSPTYPDYLQLINALKGCRWYKGELEQFVLVNPRTDNSTLNDDCIVSFVPMTAVGNRDNTVAYEEQRYSEVKTGYTMFQRGDLLWAKITPCMQNGKSCLVSDLPTPIGFGSTEFHVLRRNSEEVYMPYIWAMLANATILKMVQAVFNGSAGQQRVSDSFLKKFPLPLPDVAIQKEIADSVFAALEKVYVLKREAEAEWAAAKARFERELLSPEAEMTNCLDTPKDPMNSL